MRLNGDAVIVVGDPKIQFTIFPENATRYNGWIKL